MSRRPPRFHHDRRRGRLVWHDPPPRSRATALARRAGRLALALGILAAAVHFTLRDWQDTGPAAAVLTTRPGAPGAPSAVIPATPPSGTARVNDGDTITIGAVRIRLHGIDAPEFGQVCTDAAGRTYDCGRRAAEELRRWLDGRPLNCAVRGRDRHGRTLARCAAPDGADSGAAMIAAGWAVSFDRSDAAYAALEAQAAAARRGLWAGRFERPQAWRDAREAAQRGAGAPARPAAAGVAASAAGHPEPKPAAPGGATP